MDQRKAATIFTTIVFLVACAFLYMHFEKPTVSETIITECYSVESLTSPKTRVNKENCIIKVTATQGTHLYIEVTNNTQSEIQLNETLRIYKVSYDGNRIKVDEEGSKITVTRGTGRAEIVKKIPAGATREAVYDYPGVGQFSSGTYIVRVHDQYIFFSIKPNVEQES